MLQLLEELKILLLNRANFVLGVHTLSKGVVRGTVVDLKILMGIALMAVTCWIIIAHNHPSGSITPSE